jgi:hypothetical protein
VSERITPASDRVAAVVVVTAIITPTSPQRRLVLTTSAVVVAVADRMVAVARVAQALLLCVGRCEAS